jgi:soluble lytic murein transglycosylase-like protein
MPAWWLPPKIEIRRAAHFDLVVSAACEFGLPTALLDAIVMQESGYNTRAVSPAGARGLMQIMPSTARSLGLTHIHDPIANMRAGAQYLRQQIDRFGRVDLALAAYNAGPERRSLAMGRIPDIPETRSYVRGIFASWARLLAPSAMGEPAGADNLRPIPVTMVPLRRAEVEDFSSPPAAF